MDWINDGLGNDTKELWQCGWLHRQHNRRSDDLRYQMVQFIRQYEHSIRQNGKTKCQYGKCNLQLAFQMTDEFDVLPSEFDILPNEFDRLTTEFDRLTTEFNKLTTEFD